MGQPLFLDDTDSEIRSRVYALIRKGLIQNVCNASRKPNKPVTVVLTERGYPVRYELKNPADAKPMATVRFDRPGWPIIRNFTLQSKYYRYY